MTSIDQYPFRVRPYDHQLREFKTCAHKQSWAHFWEMGTGKSKIVIDNFSLLYLEGKIDTVVVMAKKGEYANWAYELIPDHLPECITAEVCLYSTYNMMLARGKAMMKSIVEPNVPGKHRLRIVIVNVEALLSATTKKLLAQVYKTANGVFFALDESTCAKNTDSKRSREVYFWAAKSHYRRIMTGTPVTQSPLDLWGQSIVLGKGLFGTSSFYSFRGDYAKMEPMWITRGDKRVEIKTITGYKNLDRLGKYLDLFSTRLTKSQCLDLPPKVYTKRYVEMTKEQQRLYVELRDQAMIDYKGVQLEVVHVLALITKLHQIACGQLKVDDDTYLSVENNRIDSLLELVEDYPGKVIIWANYRQTLKDVAKALADKFGEETVATYYGGTSDADRRDAVKHFQDLGSPVRFFVSNPQSGGFGLTLTAAKLVVYYSNGYNLEHRLQSEDRAHRIGQTESVTYVDMVSKDTVDERIIEILRNKKSLADEVMRERNIGAWI